MKIAAGILTVSDRCSKGLRKDESGPALAQRLKIWGWKVGAMETVADEQALIEKRLRLWADSEDLSLILTTGGTGLGPRDVTPEATKKVLKKELPGLAELIRLKGARKNPRAFLSRAVAGSAGNCLILNLPGSPRGAVESLSAAYKLIPHAIEMLLGGDHGQS